MRTTIHAILLTGLWLLGAAAVHAEEPADTVGSLPGIEITTSVDRAEMYVGDLATYTLTITYDSTYELIPPPIGANLGAFDVKDYQPDVLTTLPDGRLQSTSSFTLSTFTTGDYVIPPIPVGFILPDSSRKILLSETVPMKVQSLLGEDADSLDIRPLKAQYEFPRDWTMYYLLGAAGVLVLVGLFLFVRWRRRRRREGPGTVDLRPAWEIAFERLALLKQQSLPEEGRYKDYYIELTELTRDYLGRMYDRNVLDMTTEEFLGEFAELDLPSGLHENTGRFLRHADLVKFAKYVPELQRAEADFDYVHRMIGEVRAEQARREAVAVADRAAPTSAATDTESEDTPR